MIRMFKCVTILLLLGFSLSSFAQTQGVLGRGFFKNWSIGIGGGPNIFFGDLKQDSFLPVSSNMNEWRYAGTFTLTRQLGYVFALRAQVLYGEIAGTKREDKSTGLPYNRYFEGNILEYNLNTTINFSNFAFGHKPSRKFFVYVTLGGGVSTWATKKKDLVTHQLVARSDSNGKWSMAAMVFGGLGAYYNFGDKVNLGIEWTMRGVNSDMMDLTPGGFRYDAYSLAQVTLTYNFNRRNPAELKSPSSGKQLGPMPDKPVPFPPAATVTEKPVQDPSKKLPELITPLRFPTRDTTAQSSRYMTTDTLDMPEEAIDSSLLLGEDEAPLVMGLSFRVQVFAYRTNEYPAEAIRERFNLEERVYREYTDEWYRYTVGSFKTLKAAKNHMYQLRRNGIPDAFVARYNDGIRISSQPKH